MRLGMSSYVLRQAAANKDAPLGAIGMVEQAAEWGLDVVQFCDNLPLHALSASQLEELIASARSTGVDIEVGTGGLDLGIVRRYLEIAEQTGSRSLRQVPFSDDAAAIRRFLSSLLPSLHERGLSLAIENRIGLRSRELYDLVSSLNDPALGFCVDTANSIGLLERPMETIANLAAFALQVHLKDHIVEKVPAGYLVTSRPLGEGWLDVPAALEAFGARRAELDYFVEFWMPAEATLDETLAKERSWATRSVAAARHYLMGEDS